MRECDIVVGTLLFFSQKKYLAINGQKNTTSKEREKKSQKKKLILPMENFPQKSKTTTHTKKNEFVSQICVSLCLQFLDR
jgi:hypothetical protein